MKSTDPNFAPRRGRPPGFCREAALGTITATFRRHGYDATSLDRLAAATGLARPSLYAAFGDKREMYLAAVAESAAGIEAGMRAALALPSLREALARLFGAVIGSYAEGGEGKLGCLVICTATAAAADDAGVRDALAQVLQGMDEALATRCAAAGGECVLPPAAAGALVAATLHSIAVRARAEAPVADLEQLAAATLDAVCGPSRA